MLWSSSALHMILYEDVKRGLVRVDIRHSIANYVTDIRSTEVIPYPGISINGLAFVIQSGQLVLDKQFTIFHVGTNDTPI